MDTLHPTDILDAGLRVVDAADDLVTVTTQDHVNLLVSESALGALTGVNAEPADTDANPGVKLIVDLSSEFDVVYERAGADQTVSMEYDDPDSGVSLDRSNYPQNTGVAITIDDQAMNVDPTGDDTWVLVSDGDHFYGTVDALETRVNAAQAYADRVAAADTKRLADIAAVEPTEVIRDSGDKLRDIIRAADIALEDPLIADTEKIRIIRLAGQGDRTDESTSVPIQIIMAILMILPSTTRALHREHMKHSLGTKPSHL